MNRNKPKSTAFRSIFMFIILGLLLTLNSPVIIAAVKEDSETNPLINKFTPSADGFVKYAENEKLILSVNEKTAEFSVTNKTTGYTWYSNPQDRDTNEEIIGEEINNSRSLARVTLITKLNNKITYTVNSDCIKNNQYEIKKINNGASFKFQLGIIEISTADLPAKINMEKFNDRILKKLEVKDKVRLKTIYKPSQMEKCMQLSTANKKDIEFVYNLFQKIGYTKEDIKHDDKEFNAPEKKPKASVYLEINLTLSGNALSVSIPTNNFFKSKDYVIDSLVFGEYFGSPEKNEKGYILIPDGNGYLINISDNPKSKDIYNADIYSSDINTTQEDNRYYSDGLSLPVYGIQRGNNAMVSVLENGAALAQITVEPLSYCPYYNVYYKLKPHKYETSKVQEQNMLLFSSINFNQPYEIKYMFLDGENISYVDMAKAVQKEIFGDNFAKAVNNYGFSIDVISSITKTKSMLGIPVTMDVSTTSYDELVKMCSELKDKNLNDINLIIQGWMDGGLSHINAAKKVKASSALGGEKKLKKLIGDLNKLNITPYMDFNIQKVNDVPNDIRGLFYNKDYFLAKDILGEINPKFMKRYDTLLKDDMYSPTFYANPASFKSALKNISNYSKKIGYKAVSFNDIAKSVYSSGRGNKDFIDKNRNTELIESFLSDIQKKVGNISVENGNYYVLKYVRNINNLNYRGSNNNLFSESVPFIPLILNGKVSYSYEPYHLSFDKKQLRLKIAETGADLYYKLVYKDQSIFKDTQYNTLYSTQYSLYKKSAVDMYSELGSKLSKVKDSRIINHKKLADMVYATEFENGFEVITNYSTSDYNYMNTVVPKEDFILAQKGE